MNIDVSPPRTAHFCAPTSTAITLRLASPSSDLLVRHVRLVRDCVASVQKHIKFDIEAAVVLPSQLLLLCDVDDGESGAQGVARLIQNTFAMHATDRLVADTLVAGTGTQKRRSCLWGTEVDLVQVTAPTIALRRAFIENAPVRAGLVHQPSDWPYSSARHAVLPQPDRAVA